MEKSSLRDVVVAVTYQCDSRCRMCGIWRKNQAGVLDALAYAALPANSTDINITGGEPFLRPDLPQIIFSIKRRCPRARIIISSNGFATERIISQMKKIQEIAPGISLAISLDGAGRAHDAIRGLPGGFEKVVATLKGLKNIGVKNLRLAFTLGDYNAGELAKVYELSRKLGLEMSLAAVHSGAYFNARNSIENKAQAAQALDWLIRQELLTLSPKRWARAYFAHGIKHFILTGERVLPDYSGRLNAFIDPAGDIYANDLSGEKIGALKRGMDGLSQPASLAPNWMICTARQAMKKHRLKVAVWLIKNWFKALRVFSGV